jgi:thioredoxin-like negative regulator of GroEL
MELATQYAITGVPTILVFKGGEVVERAVGFQEKASLQKMLDSQA